MQAGIYYGPGDIRIEERPKPAAGEQDVVVKIVRAGICGSDLTAYLHDGHSVAIWQKGEYGHDGQFGHEMAGVVEIVGEKVEGIKTGDRVFINPTTCKKDGMLSCDVAGAFSEYVLVENAAYGNNLFRLQDNVSFDEAVLIEPLSVGTHGKNCIDVKPYEKAVIYGAGTIGLCTLSALLAVGCEEPVVVDINETRLALAEQMGAKPYHAEKDGELKEFLMNHFGSEMSQFGFPCADVDVFIDCAGANTVLEQIVDTAKNGARIAVVAVYKESVQFPAAGFMSGNLLMKGSCGYEHTDIVEASHNINSRRTTLETIITHHYPHSQLVEAFKTAADPSSGALKVVIDYE